MASNIKIKPSKVGTLRKAMHAKEGEKLSISAMQAKKKNASPAMKKKLQFAINARSWQHPDGGTVKNIPIVRQDSIPIYPRQYGDVHSFANEEYLFQPQDSTDRGSNNYYYPENIFSRAGKSNILPAYVNYSPGYQEYVDRTDMPAAGYMTPRGNDTIYSYRKNIKQDGKDTIVYPRGSRADVQAAMNVLNNPTGKGAPTTNWMQASNRIKEYYNAVGAEEPREFAWGGITTNDNMPQGKYYNDRQTGQNIANAAGNIPIVGLFKGIGEGVSNAFAPEDKYGVKEGSNAKVAAASMFNPLATTTSGIRDIKKGKINFGTASKLGAFGPLGMIGGGIMANQEAKQERNKARIREGIVNSANEYNQNLVDYGDGAPTFAMGGVANGVNSEIERRETAMTPNGDMAQYNLPSHGNIVGDNMKEFNPGTMIFSDRLKFNKNTTFAQEQAKYKKISDNADKMLNNNGSTKLTKTTAERNKDNAYKMSISLFNKQEAMKKSIGKQSGVPKAQDGYTIPYGYPIPRVESEIGSMYNPNAPFSFYPDGIDLQAATAWSQSGNNKVAGKNKKVNTPVINREYGVFNDAGTFNPVTPSASKLREYNQPSYSNGLSSGLANMPSYDKNLKSDPSTGMSTMAKLKTPGYGLFGKNSNSVTGGRLGNIGGGLLENAPAIYNIAQGLFSKREKLNQNRYANPYTNQIRSAMANRRYNIDPILAANLNANAVYNRNVQNAGGGDRANVLSNLMAGLNARYGADATAYSQQNNMNNQYLSEQAQMDYGLGAQNVQGLMTTDDINARNAAAQRNYLAQGLTDVQQSALTNRQMRNQMASQNAYLKTLGIINPYFNQWMNLDYLGNYNVRNNGRN